jgi:hypothetical protein
MPLHKRPCALPPLFSLSPPSCLVCLSFYHPHTSSKLFLSLAPLHPTFPFPLYLSSDAGGEACLRTGEILSLTHRMFRIPSTLLPSLAPSLSGQHLQAVWEEQVAKNPTEAGSPIKIK